MVEISKIAFQDALKRYKGNVKKVAEIQGLSYATAWRYAVKYFPELVGKPSQPKAPKAPTVPESRKAAVVASQPAPGATPGNGKAAGLNKISEGLSELLKLQSGKVDEPRVRQIVKAELDKFEFTPNEFKITTPSETRTVKGITPKWFQDTLDIVNQGIGVYLSGPAGCGKSTVARMIAESLGLRFGFISLSGGISESFLMGWLVPGENGKFEYMQSQFVDFYENGGLFLLDELDAADANVLLVINSALANGQMAIAHRRDKPLAKRHPDFRIIATGNTLLVGANREYQGRTAIDRATIDRFEIVLCDYDSRVEKSLVDSEVLDWGNVIREKIKAHNLRRDISTRKLIHYSKMKAANWSMNKIRRLYFSDWQKTEIDKIS